MRLSSLNGSHVLYLSKVSFIADIWVTKRSLNQRTDFSRFDTMNRNSFLRGCSQCQRQIHSSTQMMSYIGSRKITTFCFYWSLKHFPQASTLHSLFLPLQNPKTSKSYWMKDLGAYRSRIKDLGPCFGTNGHPRRDTDVIFRLSKSTIEDLPFYEGFMN